MSLKSFHAYLLSSVIFTVLSTQSLGQSLQWAKQIGGAGWDEGTAIKTNQNNDVYVVGLFIGTVDFDPGTNVFNLTSVGEKDVFICKFDAAGDLIWAKQFGDSASIDEKSSLEIDSFGNLYITNSFLGTVDFDPGPGSFHLTCQGSDRAVFVQKLDSNGNFIWAKQIGGPFVPTFPTPAHSNAIAVDADRNVFLTGYFDGTIDFDPHPTFTFNMTSQFNASDIFVCKLDTNGSFVWAKQFTGTQAKGGVGYAITVDETGNVYSTGTIGGTIDFDPGPGTFHLATSVPNQTEIYMSKLDPSGNFIWAKEMGPGEGCAIVMDENNRIYSTGGAPSGYVSVINKLDSAGNLLWARELGGIHGRSIALDTNGHVYTAGICFGTNDFDPGPGVFNLAGGDSDSFISRLDSLGNFVWAGLLTGTNQVWAQSLTLDRNNNLYTTGYFNETADFDPSSLTFNLSSPAIGYDMFLTKLSTNVVLGLEQPDFETGIAVYPNPTNGNFSVDMGRNFNIVSVNLTDLKGKIIQHHTFSNTQFFNLSLEEPSGVYLLTIQSAESKAVIRLVKK